MTGISNRQAAIRGFGWGAIAGLALVALMYLANLLLGLRTLPALLNQPILSLMPGFVFGFLIDTLQHAGKVVEEFGLIVAMLVGLGVLGAAWAVAALRWQTQYLALMFAGIGWLVVAAILLPLGGAGFLGLNDGPTTPLIWAALFAVYSVVLQIGREGSGAPGVDAGRRRLLGRSVRHDDLQDGRGVPRWQLLRELRRRELPERRLLRRRQVSREPVQERGLPERADLRSLERQVHAAGRLRQLGLHRRLQLQSDHRLRAGPVLAHDVSRHAELPRGPVHGALHRRLDRVRHCLHRSGV